MGGWVAVSAFARSLLVHKEYQGTDVTGLSDQETAASIINLHQARLEKHA